MTRTLATGLTVLVMGWGAAQAADWPQWRGPQRDGVVTETGLLPAWPEGGPKREWVVETPGESYGSAAVAEGALYITGSVGKGDARRGELYAIDPASGAVKWSFDYGPEWGASYGMARTTPTVVGKRIYLVSGLGHVVCADTQGKEQWRVDTFAKFGGRNIGWGIAESPLVVDGVVICHPGGPDAAVAALDAATGATRWTSRGLGDKSAYCSPALAVLGGRKQIVTQTENSVVGLAFETGEVLWSHAHRNQHAVHPNTAIVFGDCVLVASGYGYGAELLRVAGGRAERVWLLPRIENHFQGVILHDGRAYSSNNGGLHCFDPKDGREIFTAKELKKAQIVLTPVGMIAYGGNGQVSLARVRPDGYDMAGSFPVDFGNGEHWSTPVLANGRLFVRHGRGLAAYDVKAR